MNLKVFQFNLFPTNTYVVWDDTREAAIIDPACYTASEQQALAQFLADEHLAVKHILLTHFHFDHVFGVPFVEELCGVTCEAHPDDTWWAEHNGAVARTFGIAFPGSLPAIGKALTDNEQITFGHLTFRCIHCPGHSPGGMTYYCESEGVAFVGDTLFGGGGQGRTDLHGGDYNALLHTLHAKLFVLPDETTVYPGHGPSSTIGTERWYNNA